MPSPHGTGHTTPQFRLFNNLGAPPASLFQGFLVGFHYTGSGHKIEFSLQSLSLWGSRGSAEGADPPVPRMVFLVPTPDPEAL